MTRQGLLFLVAGGIAAVANLGSRLALSSVMSYIPAIVIAYVVGMATAFLLNRTFVFKNATNSVGSQASWFLLINLFAVVQTIVISLLLSRWLQTLTPNKEMAQTIAHAVGVIFPVFTSFVGHKYLSFRTY